MSEQVIDPEAPTTEQPDTGAPAADPAAEVEKWRALARKHEARAKENASAAARLAEIEEASKSEAQKAAEARAAAEQDAAEARAELARTKALLKYGLSEDDADLLGSGTPEEIDARAGRLAERLKAAAPPPPPAAPPATGLGKVGTPVGEVDLHAQLAAAEKAGDVARSIALKNAIAKAAKNKN